MFIWILIGLMVTSIVLGVLFRWVGSDKKRKGAKPSSSTEQGGSPAGDGSATGQGSRSLSATRWLRSLVKADDDERPVRPRSER